MLPILYSQDDLILYSYPLMMGLGWGIAYQIFMSLWPQETSRFKALLFFWGSFLFAWVGAKILFLLTLPDESYSSLAADASFWTGGGFVFYGGLLGGLVYLLFFKKFLSEFGLSHLWAIVPAITIGHGIGRIGCFLAGCCYGKPTDWWWGIFLHQAYRHPTQLIESFCLIFLGILLLRSTQSLTFKISAYLLTYGGVRFGVEVLRGDAIRGDWAGLTPSQWISFIMILAGVLFTFSKFRQMLGLETKIIK